MNPASLCKSLALGTTTIPSSLLINVVSVADCEEDWVNFHLKARIRERCTDYISERFEQLFRRNLKHFYENTT
nr:hypothetical protein CFP56_00077 [Quercus suber]